MAHWKATFHIEGVPPRTEQGTCFAWSADAASWLLRQMALKAEEYHGHVVDADEGGIVVSDGFTKVNMSWEEAETAMRRERPKSEPTFAQLDDLDPAEWIGMGPCVAILGINYVIEGCEGTECTVEPASEQTYTAFDGHRYTAHLKRHPRTGEVITGFDGEPTYSQWDAAHADECPCRTSEEGSDWEAVQEWESGDDW